MPGNVDDRPNFPALGDAQAGLTVFGPLAFAEFSALPIT